MSRLNKQSHELQQMVANDERLDERTRQMITARKNKLRNQAKEQESPERAKPKARSEPFKLNTISKQVMQKALLLRMMRTRKQHMNPKEKVEGHRILEEQLKTIQKPHT